MAKGFFTEVLSGTSEGDRPVAGSSLNPDLRRGSGDMRAQGREYFPFDAWEFEDIQEISDPELELITPWSLVLANPPILSSLTASLPVFTDASKALVSNTMTGTGSVVMSVTPTITGSPVFNTTLVDVNTTSFTIDATSASNISLTAADLTISTATSGDIVINAVDVVNIDGDEVWVDTVAEMDLTAGTILYLDAPSITLDAGGAFLGVFDDDSFTDLIVVSGGAEARIQSGALITFKVGGAIPTVASITDSLFDTAIDFSVATDKFTVASATGNTAVAGTLDVGKQLTITDIEGDWDDDYITIKDTTGRAYIRIDSIIKGGVEFYEDGVSMWRVGNEPGLGGFAISRIPTGGVFFISESAIANAFVLNATGVSMAGTFEVSGKSTFNDSVGIGTIPTDNMKLRIVETPEDIDDFRAIYCVVNPILDLDTAYDQYGMSLSMIPSGSGTYTGDMKALYLLTLDDRTSNTPDMRALEITYGARTNSSGLVAGHGLYVKRHLYDGTASGTLYDIYLEGNFAGSGTATQIYGIYQSAADDNYLAGALALNSTLDVTGIATFTTQAVISGTQPRLVLEDTTGAEEDSYLVANASKFYVNFDTASVTGAPFIINADALSSALTIDSTGVTMAGTLDVVEEVNLAANQDVEVNAARTSLFSSMRSDRAWFSHYDQRSNTNNYSVLATPLGTATHINAAATGDIFFRIDNTAVMKMNETGLNIGSSDDPTQTLTVDGTTHFGGATDFTETEADGTLVFNGAATVWEDLQVSISNIRIPTSNAPTERLYAFGIGGGVTFPTLGFDVGDYLYFDVQTSHSMKLNTVLDNHIHFSLPNTTDIGDRFQYQLDVIVASINVAWAVPSGSPFTSEHTIVANDTYHRLLDVADIPASNSTVSTLYKCKLTRIAATTDEYGSEVYMNFTDGHYEKDTAGSRTELAK
jgi:hypothetical protein